MSIKLNLLTLFAFAGCTVFSFAAEKAEDKIEDLRQQGYTITAVTPIFSQLLAQPIPKGFKSVFENITQKGAFYIHEFVQDGETVDDWTQMLTDTGMKDMAANAKASPQAVALGMANGFKKTCPTSFSILNLGEIELGQYKAFAVVSSCGITPTESNPHSESALIVAIKGEKDYYTVQWAERGAKSTTPLALDKALWADRLQKLLPIKLCPVSPEEKAPYPSCVGH